MFKLFEVIADLTPEQLATEQEDGELPGVRFTDEAQDIFDEWRASLEVRLRSGDLESPAFESHLAKYRALFPSLALIFHLAEIVTSVSFVSAPAVGLESAKRAAAWCEFLEAHARKIYAAEINAGMSSADALADQVRPRPLST